MALSTNQNPPARQIKKGNEGTEHRKLLSKGRSSQSAYEGSNYLLSKKKTYRCRTETREMGKNMTNSITSKPRSSPTEKGAG